MSFAAELKDFVSGFKSGFEMGKPKPRSAAEIAEDRLKEERAVFQRGAGAIPDAPSFNGPRADAGDYGTAIAGIESGGRYDAVGPETKGDRPYGKYQVMGANVPSWTMAALGRTMTPEEFLADPDAQERTFKHRFGQYVEQYGPEGAASMWHSGRPTPGNRRDVLGTTTADYVRRFRSGLGQRAALPLDEEPVIFAATGGLIEEPARGSDDDTRVRGADLTGDEDDGPDPNQFLDIDTIAEMTDTGFAHLQNAFGFNKAGVPGAGGRSQEAVRAFAHNVGAPSPSDVETIKNTVDPRRKLPSEELRAIAGWNALYKYHTRNGNAAGAQRAAGAMLMYAKQAAQIAGSTAQVALEDGDIDGAVRAIQQGYEALPDGKSLKVTGKSRGGVKYQVVDENGDVTDQGEAGIDQMMKLATGMQNGTEWFRAANLLRARNPKAKQEERRAAARSAFEDETTDDRDFVNTLTDAQRDAYDKMDPRDKREFAQRHERRMQEEAKAGRFEERQATAAEKEQYTRSRQAFLAAQRQGNWEKQRDTQMSQFDRRLAAYERDLSDRNVRHEESAADRRKRYEEIDRRILERGAGGTIGGKLTAAEAREERRKGALELGVDAIESRSDLPEGTDPEAGPWTGPVVAQERVGALRAQHGFQNAVKENKNNIDMDATYEAVDEFWKDPKRNTPELASVALKPQERDIITGVAAGIGRGNNVSTEQAIRVAIAAVNKNNPIRFVADPSDPQARRVQIGDGPPVRLGADELNAIAMARGGALNPARGAPDQRLTSGVTRDARGASGNPDSAGPAAPGVGGNPRTVSERGVARGLRAPLNQVQEAQAAIERERRARRRRAVEMDLDLDYSGDVGMIRP